MKLRLGNNLVPYPIFTIKGRLRLCGLLDSDVLQVVNDIVTSEVKTEEDLLNRIREILNLKQPSILRNFDILTRYEVLRGDSLKLPAIVVVIEGASASGKSLIALELMHDLTATRFISTDSVRQVLRGILKEDQYPELFCHTYQAHTIRQSGPQSLEPVIRGFLAQCEIITPHIVTITKRIITEGAIAVVEGVHIKPGAIQDFSSGIIEVLIDPDIKTHKAMFASKHEIGKLRTVSDDMVVRDREFEATRLIQEYMRSEALREGVPIIPLTSYENARLKIAEIIMARVKHLLESYEEGVS